MQRNQQESCGLATGSFKQNLLLNKLRALADNNFMVDQLVEEFIGEVTASAEDLYDKINHLCDERDAKNIIAQFFRQLFSGNIDNMSELIETANTLLAEYIVASSLEENSVIADAEAIEDDNMSISDLVMAPYSPNFDSFTSDSEVVTDFSDSESDVSEITESRPSTPTGDSEQLNHVHATHRSLLPPSALSLLFRPTNEIRQISLLNPPLNRYSPWFH